ncbi:MAG: hypothetical protein IGR80_06135 [Synechococcales cyanobacterium K44_A2020_017]|uniref:hypothetical protein n=1 Tax=Leptolyngbya sp. CCY15150 TaxID=2767772 RepID=UPI00194EB9A6|nr:hypothetical protein [Synechococcales cyanobacterium K32_A2020_035]MBF2094321.1 hypothetical protein [Synechococcales cyanobacterium K44_A2020_017]
MKYFFLSDGWVIGRVWGIGGLWDELAWRRNPELHRMNLYLVEQGETLWLYRVEDAVVMVEVKPGALNSPGAIGQVVLKRLITAEQVLERLCSADAVTSLSAANQPKLG